MSDEYATKPSFYIEHSTDDDSGISSTSEPGSIKSDSRAESVRSWDSESQRSWMNDEDDDDDEADDALGRKYNQKTIQFFFSFKFTFIMITKTIDDFLAIQESLMRG